MMATILHRCTICGRELESPHVYGERTYCNNHITTFHQDVKPLWRASGLTLGMLIVLIAALAVLGLLLGFEFSGTPRIVISAAVALAPTFFWIAALYRASSRMQVELSPLLPTVFVLGVLIAAAVTRPFLFDFINLDLWLTRVNASNRFIGHILLGGSFHAFILYAIIRYSTWRTPSFEHRADGVLFSMMAGWGYATALNMLFLLDQNGLSLVTGSFRLLSHAAAYLATSLVIGFFLGRNRFEELPVYYLSGGVVLAAVVNGLMLYGSTELNNIRVRITSDGFTPWPGLVMSLVLLVGVYAAIYGLIQRHNALTKARLHIAEDGDDG